MAEKRKPHSFQPSSFLNQLADAFFGPSPRKQNPQEIPASGKSEVYGIQVEMLRDADEDEGPTCDMVIKVRACKPRKVRSRDVRYPHLSRENPEVKEYADNPTTANRWCIIRDGRPHQSRSVNRECDPRWLGDLGSLKDARTALLFLCLNPPITHFACYPPDAEPVLFPVDETQAPAPVIQAPVDSDQAPDVSEQAPVDVAQAPGEIPEGKSPEPQPKPAETGPDDSEVSNPRPMDSDAPEVNSVAGGGNV